MNALMMRKVYSAYGFSIQSISAFAVCSPNTNIIKPLRFRGCFEHMAPKFKCQTPKVAPKFKCQTPKVDCGKEARGNKWRRRGNSKGKSKTKASGHGGPGKDNSSLKWLKPRYWTHENGAFLVLVGSIGFTAFQLYKGEVPGMLKKLQGRWDRYEESKLLMKKDDDKFKMETKKSIEDLQGRWNKYEESKVLMKKDDDKFKLETKKSLEEVNGKMDTVIDQLKKGSSWWGLFNWLKR